MISPTNNTISRQLHNKSEKHLFRSHSPFALCLISGLSRKNFCFFILLFLLFQKSYCSDPVTVIVNLTPPYTPFLNEYGTIGVDKLQVTLIVNDNRMINHPAKLQMYVEKVNSGVVMYTGTYAPISPIFLTGGSTEILTGVDLAPYFRATNNVFSGFDQAQYQFTGRIPDGQYRIGFQVVDAQRSNVILSNTVYTQPGWFVLNDVPQLNLPRNNSEERVNDIQNVQLEWFPRHLGSMNSAFMVSYQVELFAIRVPGMEPNQVALSAMPDFTDITYQNKYVLSSDKYMLEPGVEYAWRVKAITDQGLTLFVNNGFSEVNSFVYGSLCPLPSNTFARTYSSDRAFISWNGDPLHSSYETRIRAHYAEDPVWHTFKGYDNSVEINQILRANTTYDYQVRAICLTTESEFSTMDTFRTTGQVNENFICGADDTAKVTNKVPKDVLRVGEYIYNGQFPVKLTTISGNNGLFSGTGRVRIPFMNNIQVNMKFVALNVNELNQVYGGEMISIYNPNSKFYIDDITDLWSVGDQVGNVITGLDSAAIHLNYAVNDASGLNVSFNGNTVTVNGAATTILTATGGTTISDSKGNIYAVDADGNVTQVGVSGGTNNADYAANATEYNKLNNEMQIAFTDYESDLWAFDTWRDEYEGKQLIACEYEDINGYKVPWKLIPAGKSGTVEISIFKGNIDLDSVVFKTPTGTEYFMKDGKLTMIGGKTGDVQEIYALYPQGDSLISIGKLKVATYEMLVRKMMLVPVGKQKIALDGIKENVNKAWLPYGVEWKVSLDEEFTDTTSWDENGDGKLEAGESGFFSMYSSEMNKLNTAYQTSRGTSEDILYIFVFGQEAQNSDNKELLGDMPLSSQFGYIFKPTDDEISYKTIAHESGHGFFQLRHTFNEDYGLANNDNMMDYSTGTYLFKQQWDAMFDPQRMIFAWKQNDEEGAMAKDTKYHIKIDGKDSPEITITQEEINRFYTNFINKNNEPTYKSYQSYFFGKTYNPKFSIEYKKANDTAFKTFNNIQWCLKNENGEVIDSASYKNQYEASIKDNNSVVIWFNKAGVLIPIYLNFTRVMPSFYFNKYDEDKEPKLVKLSEGFSSYGIDSIRLITYFKSYYDHLRTYNSDNSDEFKLNLDSSLDSKILNIKQVRINKKTMNHNVLFNWYKYPLEQGVNTLQVVSDSGDVYETKITVVDAPNVTVLSNEYHDDGAIGLDSYDSYSSIDINKKFGNETYYEKDKNGQFIPLVTYTSYTPKEIHLKIETTDSTVIIDGYCRYKFLYSDSAIHIKPRIMTTGTNKLELVFKTPSSSDGYITCTDEIGNLKGKIKLVDRKVTDKKLNYKLYLLVFDGDSSDISLDFIDNFLNKSFSQIGKKFIRSGNISTIHIDSTIFQNGLTTKKGLFLDQKSITEILKKGVTNWAGYENYNNVMDYLYEKTFKEVLSSKYYNIIYTPSPMYVGGYSYGSRICFISSTNINDKFTVSHEIGHNLGLKHIGEVLGKCPNVENENTCEGGLKNNNIMGYDSNNMNSFWHWQESLLNYDEK